MNKLPLIVPRVCLPLLTYLESDPEGQTRVKAFHQGLENSGFTIGRNVRIEYRWAGGELSRIQQYASELVELQPHVILGASILGASTPVIAALVQVTRSIPIVFVAVGDPVGNRFVSSFAKPGGNLTGFTNFEPTMGGKWVQLLKEIAPTITRAAIIFNPGTAGAGSRGGNYMLSAEPTGPRLGIELTASPVHDDTGIDRAIESIAFHSGGA
jgi:putative tryptophan/tyrosine transport system substrate-binding protein